jgi:hypothetical protein
VRVVSLATFAFLLLFSLPTLGAPPFLRPYAGRGMLIISSSAQFVEVAAYEYPGVRPKGTVQVADVPSLSPAVTLKEGEIGIATMALREGYARIAVAPSGEALWIEIRSGWRAVPWERFLPGRTIRVATGVRESASRLRQAPSESGTVIGTNLNSVSLVVNDIRDDWAHVQSKVTPPGWLRWRDGDGRMLVTVE